MARAEGNPVAAEVAAGFTIAYALSPIDLIPDFIPVLGYLDDLIILPPLVALTMRLISPAILSECRREAENLWVGGKPKNGISRCQSFCFGSSSLTSF